MSATISVIVPTFNAAASLQRCLTSLLAQTCELHEVIVIDDGSSDDSSSIADAFAELHPSVRVARQQNQGVSAARNLGLASVTGDFIGFVDPDDWVSPEMFARLGSAAIETGAPVAVLRQQSVLEPLPRQVGAVHVLPAHEALSQLLQLHYPSSVCAHIYSRQLLKNVRFDTRVGFFEDLLFGFEVLKQVDRVALVDGIHYFYEPGDGGANLSALSDKHLSSFVACASIRQAVLSEGLPLRNGLAHLEAHCLRVVVYKAASEPGSSRAVAPVIGAFARSILPGCRESDLGWRLKLLVQATALTPRLLLGVAGLAIQGKRALPGQVLRKR